MVVLSHLSLARALLFREERDTRCGTVHCYVKL